MDELSRARRRVARALALWSAAGPLGACGAPAGVAPQADAAVGEATKRANAPAPPPARPSTPPPAPAEPAYDRTAPIPGDPPWVDGYNPEEATCPSGNWCAPRAAVEPLVVGQEAPVLGCPPRLAGTGFRNVPKPDAPVYHGISHEGAMMAAFNENRTRLYRKRKKTEDLCCYHWFEYCSGRPILGADGHPRLPTLATVDARAADEAARAAGLAFAADARAEWAAVWAFRRALAEIEPWDPPAALRAALRRAARDEVVHTRLCLGLAHRLGVRARLALRSVPAPPRALDAVGLALAVFDEGCVAETVAALVAAKAAAGAEDPVIRKTLARIARDEADHAAGAQATCAWLARTDARVRPALAARLRRWRRLARRPPASPPNDPAAVHLPHLGRLGPHERHAALGAVVSDLLPAVLGDLPRA